MNKVILNQVRQQQMLEDIVQHLKANNNESMCDEDDVILEGFPLDSLDRYINDSKQEEHYSVNLSRFHQICQTENVALRTQLIKHSSNTSKPKEPER